MGLAAGGSRRTSRASAVFARGSSSSSCSAAMNSLSSACSTGHCHDMHVSSSSSSSSLSSACSTGHCHAATRKRPIVQLVCFTDLFWLHQLRLNQLRLNQLRLNQLRLNQLRLNQLRLNQIRLNQIRLNQLRLELCLELLPSFCHPRVYAQPMLQKGLFFRLAHLNRVPAPYTGSHEIP